jgi:hypothetical protein
MPLDLPFVLDDLIAQERDLISAIRWARRHLTRVAAREALGDSLPSHERQLSRLSALRRHLSPAARGSKRLVATGRVAFASRRGDDAVLDELRRAELDLWASYARTSHSLAEAPAPPRAREA